MGVAGTLEFLSDLLSSAKRSKKKKKQVNTVAIKIRMDCEGCVRKVKKVLSGVKGMHASYVSYFGFFGLRENSQSISEVCIE